MITFRRQRPIDGGDRKNLEGSLERSIHPGTIDYRIASERLIGMGAAAHASK